MIAYSYNPTTGRFVGPVTCDPSPLEEGEYLLPAFATFDGPPESVPEGHALHWTGVIWQAVPPPPVPEPEPPTEAEVLATFSGAVQAHLDAVAQSWGYDNVYTAATYAEEPAVAEFQREGKSLRAWRSRVWAAARQALADVQGGKTPQPTVADLIASLPPAPSKG